MVRLRREIEGIRVDRAFPPPPWADDERASAALTPWFDAEICATDARRVLLAGAPRLDLAVALAEADRFVTLCDLPSASVAGLHARLAPAVAGRIQLVDKPYGQASFAPSSYDIAVYSDILGSYEEPEWVAHKLARELKVDALLFARLWVHGPLPELEAEIAATEEQRPAGFGERLGRSLARHPRLPKVLLEPLGADAVDRGAWQIGMQPRHSASEELLAIDSRLRIESVTVGDDARAAYAALAAHGRGPIRRAALAALAATSAAEATLPSEGEARIVTLRARRALGDRRLMAGRLR